MKRKFLGACLLILPLANLSAPRAPAASPPALNDGGVSDFDLQRQLETGLKARRPVEFAYLAKIVAMVQAGTLPAPLVTSTFGWARQRPERRLQYFQFALQARAKKLNIKTPDLSDQGVGISSNGGQHGASTP